MNRQVLSFVVMGTLMAACQAGERSTDVAGIDAAVAATSGLGADPAKLNLRDEIYERAKKRKGGAEPTRLDLWNEFQRKAAEDVGLIEDYGESRVVPRGAKPEILIRGEEFLIDGKPLKIGDSIAKWKAALGSGSRCSFGDLVFTCIWDQLGVEVGAAPSTPDRTSGFQISLNLELRDPLFPEPRPSYLVAHSFAGYLELDGYGIDSQTKFWEIRASVDPKRNLRCGSRDCSHPHGSFSDKANLYFRLNGATEQSNVYEISISSTEAALNP